MISGSSSIIIEPPNTLALGFPSFNNSSSISSLVVPILFGMNLISTTISSPKEDSAEAAAKYICPGIESLTK